MSDANWLVSQHSESWRYNWSLFVVAGCGKGDIDAVLYPDAAVRRKNVEVQQASIVLTFLYGCSTHCIFVQSSNTRESSISFSSMLRKIDISPYGVWETHFHRTIIEGHSKMF